MNFLRDNRRISLNYDGKDIFLLPHTVNTSEKDGTLITEYVFDDGLKITNEAKKIDGFSAYEWVNFIENTSDKNSGVISFLWDVDVTVPFPHEDKRGATPWRAKAEKSTIVHSTRGSVCSHADFATEIRYIHPGQSQTYKCRGGRSSDDYAPFFNVYKDGVGVIIGLGWTGQWNFRLDRECETLRIMSKIEDTEFYLEPGEKIRTSSVTMLFYNGSYEESQNIWRRLILKEYSPTLTRVKNLPLCGNIWGGTDSLEAIRRVEMFRRLGMPFEYIWMDAGWCGHDTNITQDEYTGDWSEKVGDWVISPIIHPNGLVDVAETIHNSGYKYILWFEPERARVGTPITAEHPEYCISNGGRNMLVNLGNPEAYDFITGKVFGIIEDLKLDCYRQDFNFQPLEYWRLADKEHRRGITEIKHINALYKFFDDMLSRFPNLIIDNCASGGRRIDMEMIKRSFPLWRSDAQCPADPVPEVTQMNSMNFAKWLPYTGTGCGRVYDTYLCRSSYAPGMATNFAFSMSDVFCDTEEKLSWLKARCEELLFVRRYFAGDFYQLTEPSIDESAWCASQYHISESDEGMVQVFKRQNSSYTQASFALRGINEEKSYLISDVDGGEWTVSGKELSENGFTVGIKEKRVAKIYIYKAI